MNRKSCVHRKSSVPTGSHQSEPEATCIDRKMFSLVDLEDEEEMKVLESEISELQRSNTALESEMSQLKAQISTMENKMSEQERENQVRGRRGRRAGEGRREQRGGRTR